LDLQPETLLHLFEVQTRIDLRQIMDWLIDVFANMYQSIDMKLHFHLVGRRHLHLGYLEMLVPFFISLLS
jgi:hypothetical protein